MPIKSEVGVLIRKGASLEEIKKRIPDFPDTLNIEYFISLGYSKSTSQNYISLLKKNTSKTNNSLAATSLIMSKNANVNNIILDTCALKHKETRNILFNSTSVTILYSLLKEFDKIQKKHNVPNTLKYWIREETKKMLLSDKRYKLVPYDWKNSRYTDDSILNYLFTLPFNDRPTILTADQNFALRAKCLGFDYILYMSLTQKQTSSTRPKSSITQKKATQNLTNNKDEPTSNLGVNIIYDDGIIKIHKYNPNATIFSVTDNLCKDVSNTVKIEENIDYLVVIADSIKHKVVKVQKIWFENNEKGQKNFKYFYNEELNTSDNELHEKILQFVQNLLIV